MLGANRFSKVERKDIMLVNAVCNGVAHSDLYQVTDLGEFSASAHRLMQRMPASRESLAPFCSQIKEAVALARADRAERRLLLALLEAATEFPEETNSSADSDVESE